MNFSFSILLWPPNDDQKDIPAPCKKSIMLIFSLPHHNSAVSSNFVSLFPDSLLFSVVFRSDSSHRTVPEDNGSLFLGTEKHSANLRAKMFLRCCCSFSHRLTYSKTLPLQTCNPFSVIYERNHWLFIQPFIRFLIKKLRNIKKKKNILIFLFAITLNRNKTFEKS